MSERTKHVCVCAMLTEEEIKTAALAGEHITAYSRRTGATTACGSCYVEVYAIFQDAREERQGQNLLPFSLS